MSPEQLKNLAELSRLFEEGLAAPKHIRQLSELLAEINQKDDLTEQINLTHIFGKHYTLI